MSSWLLKGQGAANLVFGYNGEDRSLVGHVLRVRKAEAHTISTIDRVIWFGVIHAENGDPAQDDLSYISEVMAPLLGCDYVFPGENVPMPEGLTPLLEGVGGRVDGPGLILPDHTTFLSSSVPGYAAVGPVVCLEIKPKWGLNPTCSAAAAAAPVGVSVAAAAANGAAEGTSGAEGHSHPADKDAAPNGRTATDSAGPPSDPHPQSRVEGPQIAGTGPQGSDLDPRERYPRFMLHMLMKHVEDGVPFSLYNPLDIFSGDSDRMRRALWRLLESPSNNLRVFIDGKLVYGSRAAPLQTHSNGTTSSAARCLAPGSRPAGLVALAAELQGLASPAWGSGADINPDKGAAAVEGEAGGRRAAAAAAPTTAAAPCSTAYPRAEAAEASGAAPQAACCGEAVEAAYPRACCRSDGTAGVLDTVVRLTEMALTAEGVMARLHAAQDLDRISPEAALRIYLQLHEALQQDGAAAAAEQLPSGLAAAAPATVRAATAAERIARDADWGPRLEALRGYLTSVTAKDCGIMVTLQRALPRAQAGSDGEGGGGVGAGTEAAVEGVALRGFEGGRSPLPRPSGLKGYEGADQGAGSQCTLGKSPQEQRGPSGDTSNDAASGAIPDSIIERGGCSGVHGGDGGSNGTGTRPGSRPWARLLRDPVTGQSYMYKVAFVDLDLKAASKIPRHVDLDRRLAACARENAALLAELAGRAGWPQ